MAIIESVGTVRLETWADIAYIIKPGNVLIRYGTWPVEIGDFGDWTPLGVEKIGDGYQVVWKNGTADEYKVWTLDSSGHYLSEGPILSGSSPALLAFESTFGQNFNGDAIVGPASAVIELAGSTVLAPVGSTYYLYASGTSSGPQLKMSGAAVVAGQFGAWKPIGVETSGDGYQVVWQDGTADRYIVWTVDGNANWLSQGTILSGSSFGLQSLEAIFGQDFNNDLTTGLTATTIEASEATTLIRAAGTYLLYAAGTSTGPQLKMSGAAVTVGQFGAWEALGAERAGSGYEVVWKNGTADQYVVWTVDGSGNWLSQGNVLSGTSAELQGLEIAFNQDFNGLGGFISTTVIDNLGTAGLERTLNTYMLIPNGGTVGPVVRMSGTAVITGQFGTWTPLGAEQLGSGYQVVWRDGLDDRYVVWTLDGAGSFLKQGNLLTGGSVELQGLEVAFNQDFNGVGGIASRTDLDTYGAIDLAAAGSAYMVVPHGSAVGPLLRYGGAVVTVGQFAAWAPIGVEQSGSGYAVVWKNGGAEQYLTWYVDGTGEFLSQTPVVAGSSWYLQSFELTALQQDLNRDGTIGPQTSVVESSGGASLTRVADAYFINHGSGPWIAFGGAYAAEGQFGTWTPIAAERTMVGYDVAWKSGDQYVVWHLDGGGNWTSQSQAVWGSNAALQALEVAFQQNLNFDGLIATSITIESSGSTSLVAAGSGYLLDGAGTLSGPVLSYGGNYVTAGQFGAWTPVAAEWTGNGYQVAWKMGAVDQYVIWSTDSAGNFTSMTATMFGASTAFAAFEPNFQQDVNQDGWTGVPISMFSISLTYDNPTTGYAYGSYAWNAAARWQQVIVGDLPEFVSTQYGAIDDLLIKVSVVSLDGRGGTLAQAAPDLNRSSGLPAHGFIQIDSADIESMVADGTLTAVLTHEIGHVLGIGTRWSSFDLTSGNGYDGLNGLFAYQLLSGNSSASFVPLETDGGPGTAGIHWSESAFGNELMTGISNTGPAPLSILTVAALQDLGYRVNYSAADAYAMPVNAGGQASGTYVHGAGTLTKVGTTSPIIIPASVQDEHHDQGWMLS